RLPPQLPRVPEMAARLCAGLLTPHWRLSMFLMLRLTSPVLRIFSVVSRIWPASARLSTTARGTGWMTSFVKWWLGKKERIHSQVDKWHHDDDSYCNLVFIALEKKICRF